MTNLIVLLSSCLSLFAADFQLPPANDRVPLKVGGPAPDFVGNASNKSNYRLSKLKGKYVVLEWQNKGCPFSWKHYESGNMQALQKRWTKAGVVWLTVISSAPGKQGYVTAEEEEKFLKEQGASPTAAILDPDGKIGMLYDAKTTPHMFIIDPKGKLIYNGAIDDKPTKDKGDIKGAKNYVNAALEQSMSGTSIVVTSTQSYGCSIKYADK
jgi:hypothetical protein